MAIPSFKQVNINFASREKIYNQLSLHQFGQLPYILTISHLEEEVQALKYIEDYLEEHDISNYPYPIYIISKIKLYKGPFSLFEKIEDLPKFYKQKIKQLNTKENKILQKIYLKQQNLMNMNGVDFTYVLKQYADSHKMIYNNIKESDFLDRISTKLEEYYDKK